MDAGENAGLAAGRAVRPARFASMIPIAKGKLGTLLAAFLLCAFWTSPARAHGRPLSELRREAKAGNVESQFELGIRLSLDEPEARDLEEAIAWLRKSAEQGHVEAQHYLGLMYHSGRGVPRDPAQALRWWRLAAAKGQASAQFWVGDAYEHGLGAPLDFAEAAKWYRRSAEQGNPHGQASLGDLYAKGLGVPRNDAEAVAWYRRAADQHIPSGEFSLGEMYRDGRGVAKDEAAALEWFRRAAEQDFTVAETEIGEAYESGRGVARDLVCAYLWYGIAERGGFDLGKTARAAVATKMDPDSVREGDRLLAAAEVHGGVLSRPLCAGENVSLSLADAELSEVLMVFRTLSGYAIEAPADARGKVTVKVDDAPWERALSDALSSAGYRWRRDGAVIRVEPLPGR